MGQKIVSRPGTKEFRDHYENTFRRKAGVVQSVEQLPCKQRVEGSSPSIGSILIKTTEGDIRI